MPTAWPKEFRDDVVAGIRPGATWAENAVPKAGRLAHVRCCHWIRRGPGKRPGALVNDDLVPRESTAEEPNRSC